MHAPGIVRSKVCWTGPSSDSPHGDDVRIVTVIAILSLFWDSGHLCRDVRATPIYPYLPLDTPLFTYIDRQIFSIGILLAETLSPSEKKARVQGRK